LHKEGNYKESVGWEFRMKAVQLASFISPSCKEDIVIYTFWMQSKNRLNVYGAILLHSIGRQPNSVPTSLERDRICVICSCR